jgi:hypothetical protein
MTGSEMGRCVLAPGMALAVTVAPLALPGSARAEDSPDPVVVTERSALPAECVSLGDVSVERFMATSPEPDRVPTEAVQEARQKGATHLVTESFGHCGPHSCCCSGVAYRCPVPGRAPAGK